MSQRSSGGRDRYAALSQQACCGLSEHIRRRPRRQARSVATGCHLPIERALPWAWVPVAHHQVMPALSAINAVPVFPAGHVVGELSAQWGASAPLMVAKPVTVIAWPGLSVPVTARLNKLTLPLVAGSQVGVLQVRQGSLVTTEALKSTAPRSGTLCVLAPHTLIGHGGRTRCREDRPTRPNLQLNPQTGSRAISSSMSCCACAATSRISASRARTCRSLPIHSL